MVAVALSPVSNVPSNF